ncbi:MAG: hypothetical protein ACOCSN_06545 [Halanaeroarchaeum sp.]
MDTRVLETYVDYYLPREVVGPVVIVFSLEGVIDGLFTQFVPTAYETVGWGVVFLIALLVVAIWGAVDEDDREELEEDLEAIREEEDADATAE